MNNGKRFRKYIVSKANGDPVDPNASYFALRLDTDPIARGAAYHYATVLFKKGGTMPTFAHQLVMEITECATAPSEIAKLTNAQKYALRCINDADYPRTDSHGSYLSHGTADSSVWMQTGDNRKTVLELFDMGLVYDFFRLDEQDIVDNDRWFGLSVPGAAVDYKIRELEEDQERTKQQADIARSELADKGAVN